MKFNPSSPTQLSLLFFGGSVIQTVKKPVLNELNVPVVIKSGKNRGEVKYQNVKESLYIKGFGLTPHKDWVTKKDGIYQTNESVLKIIAKRDTTDAGKLAKYMLQIRELEKLLGTYYDGTLKFLHSDSCVHPQFSHCGYERDNGSVGGGTGTGRLSCTKPNIQNIPRK